MSDSNNRTDAPSSVVAVETAYRAALGVALAAAVFSIVVAALMWYDYSQRRLTDPFQDETYQALKAALAVQPDNEQLKHHIRVVDLRLRQQYFRQRTFAATGAVLLLSGVAVFLACLRLALRLRRKLPMPSPPELLADEESPAMLWGRWAVAGLGLVLIAGALGLSFTLLKSTPLPTALLPTEGHRLPTAGPAGQTEQGTSSRQSLPQDAVATKLPDQLGDTSLPLWPEAARYWPRFRGPGGLGVSVYTTLPVSWNAETGENILWKSPVPLPGVNSPIVWEKRVFVTGADEKRRQVYCFDADSGQLLWSADVPGTPESTARVPKVMPDTGFAAPTAATDGQRVYAIFANGDLAAFDMQGKLVWNLSLGIPDNSYGHASSLELYKGLLIVQFDQGTAKEGKSRLYGLETTTGKIVWQTAREVPNSWSSPIVVRAAGRDQLITCADPWVISYNPANGQEIWRAKVLKQDVGPSPTLADGLIYVANQYPYLSAIKPDGAGDVTTSHVVFTAEDGLPDTCSPLATKQFVFLLTSDGLLTCYDAKTGEKLWEHDFDGLPFSSSPGLAGKLVYLVSKEGKSFVVEPTREGCKIVAEGNLGEECVTSPAFQDGRIYLRGQKHLFCIAEKSN